MDTMDIDISKILSTIPKLEALRGACRTGWFSGSIFRASWDGEWTSSPRVGPGVAHLDTIPRSDIVLETPQGTLTLRKPLAREIKSDGSITGLATSSSLRLKGTEQTTPSIFRTYVKTVDLTNRVFFPAWIEDSRTKAGARARISLQLAPHAVELIWLKEGPFLMLESAAPGLEEQEFFRLSGGLRQLFSYLLGVRLDGDSCDVQLDASGAVLQVDWHPGRKSTGNIYHPIPVSWSEWVAATTALGMPTAGGPLHPEVLSRVASAFLRNVSLVAPTEYLLQFPDAPVEMRGAFLSVALESLTDVLLKQKLFTYTNPLPANDWDTFSSTLTALVSQQTTWTQEQHDVISARLRTLNSPTNREKLTTPFKALGVPLTDEDRKAIDKRNKLLHQGRLLDPDHVRNEPEAWREAYVVEMRIYTAVNRLLLTHLGYEGVIVDWGRTPVGSGDFAYARLPAATQT